MSQTESWFYFQFIRHTENDGYAFIHHGAQAVEKVITAEEAERSYRKEYRDAIKELAERAGFTIREKPAP